MKKNEVKALKEKNLDVLVTELAEKRKRLYDLRVQGVTQKLESPTLLSQTRRDVARLLTLIKQKKTSVGETASV